MPNQPTMRAVAVDRERGLALREVERPQLAESQALVRVAATSLNHGEVQRAFVQRVDGTRLGWDVAGTVEVAAADGSGPVPRTRVVGMVKDKGWAEYAAVETAALQPLPDAVSFALAATLPIAGLTAVHVLGHGGSLLGRARSRASRPASARPISMNRRRPLTTLALPYPEARRCPSRPTSAACRCSVPSGRLTGVSHRRLSPGLGVAQRL